MASLVAGTILMSLMISGHGVYSQDCGIAPLNTRIVGGANTASGAWPWQVSLHDDPVGFHICGATVISNDWLLTAAHCILSTSPSAYTVYLGRQNQTGSNPNEVARNLSRVIVHPDYNNQTLDNDITLLKMETPVSFNNYIRPVCLASNSSEFHNGTLGWATGWGKLGANRPSPEWLQEVQIPVIGKRLCTSAYETVGITNQIKDNVICAGEKNKGACQGDSGGPLQFKQNSSWIQAGVTSHGIPCALGIPEVYARVSFFQDWITSQVGGANVQFVTFTSNGNDATAPSSTAAPTTPSSTTVATTPSSDAVGCCRIALSSPFVLLVTLILCHTVVR
ncbi:chymotrypsin-like protease CTRL-1 [Synchiropus splendidus]|uniref:chymotrypsin-like protease CTRL-1 n=1 Tax=Synchiropus splendidus TaxID=270530 RepID=UPI00237E5015|nr:chymotrypsin-like protease CTRL-1 [Synchiropus splendidus]